MAMIEIRRILVPFDFSECSRAALDQALEIARWYRAEILALHVMPLWPTVLDAPTNWSELRETTRQQLSGELSKVAVAEGAMRPGVTIKVGFRDGDPTDSILKEAQEWPADLIVMGTHGRSGFPKFWLGSVTEKVLRKAPCPVLTESVREEKAGRASPMPFGRILCAVDFSAESMNAFDYALALAQEASAKLTILHVVEWLWGEPYPTERYNVGDYRRYLERDAKEQLEKSLEKVIPPDARDWCQPGAVVRVGKAYEQILTLAADEGSDLIVLGLRGRNALDLMLFGSTTNRVVREAVCPVLAICSAPKASGAGRTAAEAKSIQQVGA
jgi:nucleotide-binding universal stress UspA family protein